MSLNASVFVPLNPSTTQKRIGAILYVTGGVGRMSFNFQNIPFTGIRFGVEPGAPATVRLQESDDGKVWTDVGAADTVIAPGGEQTVNVLTQKPYLAIAGLAAKGGYVRTDILHKGQPFKGDIAIGLFGKRGLSFDFDASHLAEPPIPEWP